MPLAAVQGLLKCRLQLCMQGDGEGMRLRIDYRDCTLPEKSPVHVTTYLQTDVLDVHCLQGEDEGRSLVQVTEYILSRDGAKPVGVYALYDSQQQLQYIGLARNMVLAIKVSPPQL